MLLVIETEGCHFFAERRMVSPAWVNNNHLAAGLSVLVDELRQQCDMFTFIQKVAPDNQVK